MMHCLNIEIDNAFTHMFTKQATTASGRDKCRSLDNNVTRAFSQSMTLIISLRDHKTHFESFIKEVSFEPPRGKTNNVVSEQVRHKPACAVTEKS